MSKYTKTFAGLFLLVAVLVVAVPWERVGTALKQGGVVWHTQDGLELNVTDSNTNMADPNLFEKILQDIPKPTLITFKRYPVVFLKMVSPVAVLIHLDVDGEVYGGYLTMDEFLAHEGHAELLVTDVKIVESLEETVLTGKLFQELTTVVMLKL